jgi:hypothetical protein
MIVDREWDARALASLQRRLHRSKLRQTACVEDINYRHPRGLDKSVMQKLATCRWVKAHENVILTGPTGVGKSWLACALAHQACREGHTALYVRVPRLLQDLYVARADGSYASHWKPFSLRPTVSSKSDEARRDRILRQKRFRDPYADAMKAFREGNREVAFPEGTFFLRIYFKVPTEKITGNNCQLQLTCLQ